MADNSLDIAINILTNEGQTKAVEVLKKVQAETGKATLKTSEMKAAVRGLSHEFPLLGRVANMALNPITFSVAGITAAWKLWQFRVNEMATSLAGFEMPDVSESQLDRINRATQSLERMAINAAKNSGAFDIVKKDLDEVVRRLKVIDDLRKAAGVETGTKGIESEIVAREAAAMRLETEARAKIAAGGAPGSKEAESALAEKYSEAAKKAVKDQAIARERMMQIADWQNAPLWQRPYADFRFRARYGQGTTYDEARAVEQAGISTSQRAIDQFESFRQGGAARAGRRAMIEQGTTQLGEVETLRREITALRSKAGIARTESAAGVIAGFPQAIEKAGNNVGALAAAVMSLAVANAQVVDALRAAKLAEDQIKGAVANQRRN